MVQIDNKITEEYWDEILKEMIEGKKEPMFTNEIWEKIKDEHGYPESKTSLEIKLFNLEREGYIKSVFRRKKHAWILPSGEELMRLTETKAIDTTIARLFEQSQRIPSLEEVKTEMRKDPRSSSNDHLLNERLRQASHLLNDIDQAIRESIQQQQGNLTTTLPSDEAIFDRIGESINHLDIPIIMFFIRTQKKRYARN